MWKELLPSKKKNYGGNLLWAVPKDERWETNSEEMREIFSIPFIKYEKEMESVGVWGKMENGYLKLSIYDKDDKKVRENTFSNIEEGVAISASGIPLNEMGKVVVQIASKGGRAEIKELLVGTKVKGGRDFWRQIQLD